MIARRVLLFKQICLLLLASMFLTAPALARQVGIECTKAASGDPILKGTSFYTPEQLFAKFLIDTDKRVAAFRLLDEATVSTADLVETTSAYTLKQTYCEKGMLTDDCVAYTRAVINRSSGKLEFYRLGYYGNYADMTSSPWTYGKLTCEPIDAVSAKAWIEVSTPKF